MEKKLRFVGKLVKQGNRFFVSIPSDLYDQALELKDKELKIELTPVFPD